jgi:hypothetical protein
MKKYKGYRVIVNTDLSDEDFSEELGKALAGLSVGNESNYIIEMTDKEIKEDIEEYIITKE